jgi:hypothetical protein
MARIRSHTSESRLSRGGMERPVTAYACGSVAAGQFAPPCAFTVAAKRP